MTTLYVLPTADTHCFDEDTKTDCWSFSRDLLVQEIAKAEKRGREKAAQDILNGSFLHDQSPAKLFAKEVAAMLRREA
jgi:hypothetical protein